jgi:hypothetical protein
VYYKSGYCGGRGIRDTEQGKSVKKVLEKCCASGARMLENSHEKEVKRSHANNVTFCILFSANFIVCIIPVLILATLL